MKSFPICFVRPFLALLVATGFAAAADPASVVWQITGIVPGDTLNVRTGPGMNFPIATKLENGTGNIHVTGDKVMNGKDDWVPVTFQGGKGWTRPKYLTRADSTAAASNTDTEDAAPSPEGCYWLAKDDADRRGSSSLEICLKSQNVRESDGDSITTGDFIITILDRKKALETYNMNSRVTDGSGSHVDFLFAASSATLRKIENTDAYARGNAEAPADVIYYILFDPEIKGGGPLKSGDKAGYVTIHGQKRSLFKK